MRNAVHLLIWVAPVCWSWAFPLPSILACVAVWGLVAWLERGGFLRGWEDSEEDLRSHHWVTTLFFMLLLFLLYLPLLRGIATIREGLLIAGGLVLFAGLGDRVLGPRTNISIDPSRACSPPLVAGLATLVGILLPAGWGAFVILCMELSPVDIPDELQPENGTIAAAGFAVLAVSTHLLFHKARTGVNLSNPQGWAPLRIVGCLLAIIILVFVVRVSVLTARCLFLQQPDQGVAQLIQTRTETLNEASELGFTWYEGWLRSTCLAKDRERMDLFTWIDFGKRCLSDPTRKLELPSPLTKFLIRGGNTFPDDPASGSVADATGEGKLDSPHAVGLAVDWTVPRFWVFRSDGLLVSIDDNLETQSFSAEVGPFVHICLDAERRPLLLESGGRLLRVMDATTEVVCTTIKDYWKPIFRRLAIHPTSGEPIALDVFGKFHRRASGGGWSADDRFVPVSSTKEIGYDIARDITLTVGDEIILLDSFGDLYRSPLSGREIGGPERETHFWPDSPVGQSISTPFPDSHLIVDRHGGAYLTDHELSDRWKAGLAPTLFPRSLPREEPDIVDHAFEPGRGWIYMLTRGGRILTNYRWADVWAD